MKFCIVVGVPDVITRANLSDDRFRGFWWSEGRISHFSIDLRCCIENRASVWSPRYLIIYSLRTCRDRTVWRFLCFMPQMTCFRDSYVLSFWGANKNFNIFHYFSQKYAKFSIPTMQKKSIAITPVP